MALPDFKVAIVDGTGTLPDFRVAVVAEDASPRPDYVVAEGTPADYRVQIVAADATPRPDFRVYGISAWSPLDLGSSLLAWWNADLADLISLSGSNVTAWTDCKAGITVSQAVDASRPTYSATGFNGLPAVSGNGTSSYLEALAPAFPTGATPSEFRAVAQQNVAGATTGVRTLVSMGSTNANVRSLGRTSTSSINRAFARVGTGSTITATQTVTDLSSRHAMRAVFGATETYVSADGTAGTPVAAIPTTLNTRFRLFSYSNATPTEFWSGPARDVFVTTALTTEQQALLDAYQLARRVP